MRLALRACVLALDSYIVAQVVVQNSSQHHFIPIPDLEATQSFSVLSLRFDQGETQGPIYRWVQPQRGGRARTPKTCERYRSGETPPETMQRGDCGSARFALIEGICRRETPQPPRRSPIEFGA